MNASIEMLGVLAAGSSVSNMTTSVQVSDEGSKKIRKPYTITKSRESWTEQEHDKFLEALQLFDRDWKKIEAFVGSKTVIQIRSHAQKYFLKVQKNGTGEHVPPPRPKRKSAQPYPQKAPKVPVQPLVSRALPASSAQADTGFVMGQQQCSLYASSATASSTVSAWVHHPAPAAGNVAYVAKDVGPVSIIVGRNRSSSSSGSTSGGWAQQLLPTAKVAQETCLRASPNFAEVYKFIGNVFDPVVNGHLKKLKEMAPIDRETVLLLMRNLSINLSSPDFEEHKLFLSVYDIPVETRGCIAEDKMNPPSAGHAAPSTSDVGDDNTSVSGRPGSSTQLSESADSDAHLEIKQHPQVLKSLFAVEPADVTQHQHLFNNSGGGCGISGLGAAAPACGSIPDSPHLREASGLSSHHAQVGTPSECTAVCSTRRQEVYGLGMPSLSPRVTDGATVDAWWR
eukprot:TRINITY_DN6308_c0_g2_i1.p1 TRINITY_DN6308_c0_g2~~TRINITY_DN6308_c0_g2_i1.p1  ORF type:complete len:453 (-),score=84.05 TRINITY_DN6308_c0_g2_i1:475-1833(-)